MRAELAILNYQRAGGPIVPIAVLLLDQKDVLHIKGRSDLGVAVGEDAALLNSWLDELAKRSRGESGLALLEQLENTLSNAVRITERESVDVADIGKGIGDLYRQHVVRSNGSEDR